jgi:Na+/melibiose symporter-like transporter
MLNFIEPYLTEENVKQPFRVTIITLSMLTVSCMYGLFLSLQQIKTVEINGDSHGRPIKPIQTAIEVQCENTLNMTTRNYYSYNGSIKNITKTFLSYFIEVNTKYGPLLYINEKRDSWSILAQ